MIRVRFKVPSEDPRPVSWPIPHPYWVSGRGFAEADTAVTPGSYAILVAYAADEAEIMRFWPDAYGLDVLEEDAKITFYDRFPKPDWWES